MTTTVILTSEAYGEETFDYESEAEALAGVARLLRSCKTEYKRDHVPREIKILVPTLEENHYLT